VISATSLTPSVRGSLITRLRLPDPLATDGYHVADPIGGREARPPKTQAGMLRIGRLVTLPDRMHDVQT
jgi:hypothetical protein